MPQDVNGQLSSTGSSKGVDKDTAHIIIIFRPKGAFRTDFMVAGEEPGFPEAPIVFLEVDAATLKTPAGKMIDGLGTVHQQDLVDMTALARNTETNSQLKAAKLPNTDDCVTTYLWEKKWDRNEIESLKTQLDEKPHVQGQADYRIYKREDFLKKISEDNKYKAIWTLFEGLFMAKKIIM